MKRPIAKTILPHNSRIIPVLIFVRHSVRWALFVSILAFNFSLLVQKTNPSMQPYTLAILENPSLSIAHTVLANAYWLSGRIDLATTELALAQDLYEAQKSSASVLGASTEPFQLITYWNQKPQKLEEAYAYWEKILAEKPDYPDAYVQLAYLAFRLNKTEESKTLLQKALTLDSSSAKTEMLLQFIEKR